MLTARINKLSSSKGFTLIELLIVIAVLGVLAAVVLIAINPVEQIARARDSGVKNSVSQLGSAIQNYYASRQTLPGVPTSTTWTTDITGSGDVKVFPATVPGQVACTNNPSTGGGFCYIVDGDTNNNYVVYGDLQSIAEASKVSPCVSPKTAWYVYSSADGKAGTYCGTDATIKSTAQASPYTFGASLLP